MPRPVEQLPCGSASISSTRSPQAARAVPRLIAVVVLPTPPFWLAMARTRRGWSDFTDTLESFHMHDLAARIAEGGPQVRLEFPICSGLGQFRSDILSLQEPGGRTALQVGLGIAEQPDHRRAGPSGDHVNLQVEVLGAGVVDLGRQVQFVDHDAQEL